jgi:hypothetical protein
MIAYDVRFTSDANADERQVIRDRIGEVLAV